MKGLMSGSTLSGVGWILIGPQISTVAAPIQVNILMLTGGAVSWKSRRQDCVSLSTSEAEYVAASQCGQEVVYLREILRDFGFIPIGPT